MTLLPWWVTAMTYKVMLLPAVLRAGALLLLEPMPVPLLVLLQKLKVLSVTVVVIMTVVKMI